MPNREPTYQWSWETAELQRRYRQIEEVKLLSRRLVYAGYALVCVALAMLVRGLLG